MSSRGLALDDAAWGSPWRARRVSDKLVLSAGLLTCAVALPAWPGGVLAGVAAAVLMLGPGGVRPGLLIRCLAAPAAFIVIGAVTVLITLSWGEHGPQIGFASTMIPSALALLVRGIAGALAMFLLATTTPMVDLFAALRRARVPDPLIEVASLIYRLVFVLLESARTIREAQVARLGHASRAASYRSMSTLVAGVFVRSWTRARRLEEGLAGRGYVDALPTLDPPRHGSARFVVSSLVLVSAIMTISVTMTVLGGGA